MATLTWFEGPKGSSGKHAILMHGFGANGKDLIELAPWLDPQKIYSWHFPQAPASLGYGSWAWFPREQEKLVQVMNGNFFRNPEEMQDPYIDTVRDLLLADTKERGIPTEGLILGGFSQGSMMALWTALSLQKASAVLLFSSSLFAPALLDQKLSAATTKLPPIFQSHGREDPVLPFHNGVALRELLEKYKNKVDWHEFEGSHEITQDTVEAAEAFLKRLI